MTTTPTPIHVPVDPPASHRPSYVAAAINQTEVDSAVRVAAESMGTHLGVPVRIVHVGGTAPRGQSLTARLAQVERGESTEVGGRPVTVLSALVQSRPSPLLVLASPADPKRSVTHRGTTLSVAYRVSRPVMVVPRQLDAWPGPRRVLVPLDGTSATAFAASQAVVDLDLAVVTTTPVHVFYDETVPRFWDQPVHEYQAWEHEFRARYVDEALMDGFAVRAGPKTPSDHLLDLASQGGFDLVVAVWSQLAPGTKADVIFALLAQCPIPVLLVPSRVESLAAGRG